MGARAARARAPEADLFAPERRALDKGVIGGIILMIAAAIWFFVGWAAGYIYFYPPIMFLIGLFGLIRALGTSPPRRGRRR